MGDLNPEGQCKLAYVCPCCALTLRYVLPAAVLWLCQAIF